jgi:hypothetical protein
MLAEDLTNSVGVLLNPTMLHGREVVVDNVHDIANIDATASDTSRCDQHRTGASTEGAHRCLPLLLGAISMEPSARDSLVEQKVVNLINSAPAVGKNDRSGGRKRHEKIEEGRLLQGRVHHDDVLLDVPVGTAGAADADADMGRLQVLLGRVPEILGERGGEEHVLNLAILLVC